MPNPPNDMTASDETVAEPTSQELPAEASEPMENMIPVPEGMAGTLKNGDSVSGTVVEQDGALFIQIEPPEAGEAYTGEEPEDSGMDSTDALEKYLKGPAPTAATQ